ncbi:hypothetical protein U9M48_006373 [Paspalum notatum var. saurae]|uniref:Uncharacterized protein n=1 Tax=Paspalum notatum var. saurae TaxID=547442 RepID=A0AAQ3PU73_PASNO
MAAWEESHVAASDMLSSLYEFIPADPKVFHLIKAISAAEQASSRGLDGCLSFVCCSGRLRSDDRHLSKPAQPPWFL